MAPQSAQLPLGVRLRDAATFAAFEPGANGAALAWLEARIGAGAERGWLWGPAGSGRSHLLQAACHAAVDQGLRAIYLPASELATDPAAVLEGLEQCRLVALDDLGDLAGHRPAELALFDLCNRLAEQGGLLLAAASAAPLSHGWSLADLASRLAAAAVFRLRPLDDAGKLAALQRRARLRGLALPTVTARFILSRADRSSEALFALLDELDLASLVAQRRLTVPFVRDLLAQRSGR
ncbi:MAG: DnaA regulatory inactivator Hda [Gammaproteobacteria bacterium]|nr:DnaA regulatory inactivator Hda [Gammaproteobacteria bacterium]